MLFFKNSLKKKNKNKFSSTQSPAVATKNMGILRLVLYFPAALFILFVCNLVIRLLYRAIDEAIQAEFWYYYYQALEYKEEESIIKSQSEANKPTASPSSPAVAKVVPAVPVSPHQSKPVAPATSPVVAPTPTPIIPVTPIQTTTIAASTPCLNEKVASFSVASNPCLTPPPAVYSTPDSGYKSISSLLPLIMQVNDAKYQETKHLVASAREQNEYESPFKCKDEKKHSYSPHTPVHSSYKQDHWSSSKSSYASSTNKYSTPIKQEQDCSYGKTFYKSEQYTPDNRVPKESIYATPTSQDSEDSEEDISGKKFYKGGQFIPGGDRAPKGGLYAFPTSNRSYVTKNVDDDKGKFYKGGQFMPGGDRAPKGGSYAARKQESDDDDDDTSNKKFYKGGQFIPGGDRAPKGGIYATPTTTTSERKFYKGGQFMPNGGRAPKGGCYYDE